MMDEARLIALLRAELAPLKSELTRLRAHIGPTPIVPVYLPPRLACERYGWSNSTFYRLLGDRCIKAKKDGRHLMVDIASCEAYVASLPDAKIRPDKYRSRLPRISGDAARSS